MVSNGGKVLSSRAQHFNFLCQSAALLPYTRGIMNPHPYFGFAASAPYGSAATEHYGGYNEYATSSDTHGGYQPYSEYPSGTGILRDLLLLCSDLTSLDFLSIHTCAGLI